MLEFNARPETIALVELLSAMPPGVLLTFDQLSGAAGLPDIRKQPHLLQSALRIAEREHGVVYRYEREVGYRRLTLDQMPEVEVRTARHQRAVARKTITTLVRGTERVAPNIIPMGVQARLNAALARQGLIARIAGRRVLVKPPEPDGPLLTVPEIAQQLLDHARRKGVPG